jgi:hypothetical protein
MISLKLVGYGDDWKVEEMYFEKKPFSRKETDEEIIIVGEFTTFEELFNMHYEFQIQEGLENPKVIPLPKRIEDLNGILLDEEDEYTAIIIDGEVVRWTDSDDYDVYELASDAEEVMSDEVYCVTVDPTTWTERIWPKVEKMCESYSNVIGDRSDLRTGGEVWAATTDEEKAYELHQKLIEMYPELGEGGDCVIEKTYHILQWNNKLKGYVTVEPSLDHFMGHSDVAEFLGWEKQQVTRYARDNINGFPSPIKYQIGNRPIWLKRDIVEFKGRYQPRNG